jgi:hypothetical protein
MTRQTVRTSIDIPKDLHRRLRERAARAGCSARRLILECIERAVDEPKSARQKQRLSLDSPIVPSRGKPFDLTSDEIHDLIELP